MHHDAKYSGLPLIGVIGGSSLCSMEHLSLLDQLEITTPWGSPSSPISIFEVSTSKNDKVGHFAFIARHGKGRIFAPSQVNNRANIAALKSLGCEQIVAFSAVGSLRQEIEPGHVVLPDDVIDRTKGNRASTFFDDGITAHVSFGSPFSSQLNAVVSQTLLKLVPKQNLHFGKTLIVMEGPAFSTKAESKLYRSWGADIINMSTLPEAKLAREAGLNYIVICTSTDYDSWRDNCESVDVQQVLETLKQNTLLSRSIAKEVLVDICGAIASKEVIPFEGVAMKDAIFTDKECWSESAAQNLSYIWPDVFKS